MRIWLDNTGFQSVGECLGGTARSDGDIDGLLQFCTLVIFSDQILLNGFEPPAIAEQSDKIRETINVPISDLWIVPETDSTYSAACTRAAQDLEFLLPSAFGETLSTSEPLALSDVRTTLPRHARQFTIEQLFAEDVDLLTERAHAAVKLMVRSNGRLREAILRHYQSAESWSGGDTHRLNVFMRYHLNCELANSHAAMYGPAVARASMIRDENDRVLQLLLKATDEVVNKLRTKPLRVSSVASALLQSSRGEPLAMVREAYALKEKAAPLRKWIADATATATVGAVTFEHKTLIADAKNALEVELGIQPKPGKEALEFSAPLGAKVKAGDAITVMKWLRDRSRIAVLTDISKAAAAPYREAEYYEKLRSLSYRNLS